VFHRPQKKRDRSSLSYLVDKTLTHSQCIRLGNAMERTLRKWAVELSNYQCIKPKNKKGKHERDLLFIDRSSKVIIYAEVKCNINLDTEKLAQTIQKCQEVNNELQNEYPDYTIKWYLIAGRYTHRCYIPTKLMKKYRSITEHVIGINNYLGEIGLDTVLTIADYREIVNNLANKL